MAFIASLSIWLSVHCEKSGDRNRWYDTTDRGAMPPLELMSFTDPSICPQNDRSLNQKSNHGSETAVETDPIHTSSGAILGPRVRNHMKQIRVR